MTVLRFVNHTSIVQSDIVLFQRGFADGISAVAWQVIHGCSPFWCRPIVVAPDLTVGVGDGYGNHAPALPAAPGAAFLVAADTVGKRLTAAGAATCCDLIEVVNGLSRGAITARLYRAGALLAEQRGVVPGQKAVFKPSGHLEIARVPGVVQGLPLPPGPIDAVPLHLTGVVRADVVMTGGGRGPDAAPYSFHLQDVVL